MFKKKKRFYKSSLFRHFLSYEPAFIFTPKKFVDIV